MSRFDRIYRERTWSVDPIKFENKQWAVTDYGVENVAGPYHYYIPKNALSLPGMDWIEHMAGKNWVDERAFKEAYRQAVKIHLSANSEA